MEILKYPDPVLCEVANPVTDFGEEFLTQMAEVYETMIRLPQGSVAGLAAPQCGIRKRFFFALGEIFVNPTIKASKQMEWGQRSEERRVGKECRSRWSP